MTKNSKKITALSSGVGAAVIAAGTLVSVLTPHKIEVPYDMNVTSQYITELSFTIPQEENVDLVEMYVNESYVDNALMPNGTFQSIPLVFNNLDNVTFKMYKQGDQIGSGEFDEEDKLIYTAGK